MNALRAAFHGPAAARVREARPLDDAVVELLKESARPGEEGEGVQKTGNRSEEYESREAVEGNQNVMGNTAYEVLTLDTPPEIMIPQESNGEAIVREPYSGHPIHEVPPFTTMRAYGGGSVTALPKDNLGNAGSLGESFPSTTDRIPIGQCLLWSGMSYLSLVRMDFAAVPTSIGAETWTPSTESYPTEMELLPTALPGQQNQLLEPLTTRAQVPYQGFMNTACDFPNDIAIINS